MSIKVPFPLNQHSLAGCPGTGLARRGDFLPYVSDMVLYYLVGTVGLAYFLVFIISKVLIFEPILAHSVAIAVLHDSLNFINIPTEIFQNAPGVLLVLVVTQKVGWTVLQIGVESSGLLEILRPG